MGFFKDFKEDFSQAVNELIPGEDSLETGTNEDDLVVNTLEGEVDVESELSKLDGLLEQVTRQETATQSTAKQSAAAQSTATQSTATQNTANKIPASQSPVNNNVLSNSILQESFAEKTAEEALNASLMQAVNTQKVQNVTKAPQEDKKMADTMTTPIANQNMAVSDEVSIITEGTIIKGDIVSNGSLDVRGQVEGNVGCNGKLVVTGVVNGNSNASEFFADAAKIEGEVVSTGTVKIGLGSVIIGNVTSTSAVIAGAIKGDIDVQGPVVVDTSAVVMGNIKSRSVQINNGAVIEGFCSQCYSDVDVQGLFDTQKGN